jgi:hypothetical protein
MRGNQCIFNNIRRGRFREINLKSGEAEKTCGSTESGILSRECELLRTGAALLFQEDPFESVVELAENSDALLAEGLAKNFKHTRETVRQIAFHNESAARILRENHLLRECANVIHADIEFGDVCEIKKLRKTGIKIRIAGKLLLIRQAISHGEHFACGAEYQPAFFINFVLDGHTLTVFLDDQTRTAGARGVLSKLQPVLQITDATYFPSLHHNRNESELPLSTKFARDNNSCYYRPA